MAHPPLRALLVIHILVGLLAGCQREQSEPGKGQNLSTSGHIEKAQEYTKRTGHEVRCKALFYTEDGVVIYYRTARDYRRMGHSDEIASAVPDDKEICWACQDATTRDNIDDLCLTTAELESLGLIPRTTRRNVTDE